MDAEVILVADGAEPALVNGGLTMENGVTSCETMDTTSESQNENSGDSSTLDATEHSKEVAAAVGDSWIGWLIYSGHEINGFFFTLTFSVVGYTS